MKPVKTLLCVLILGFIMACSKDPLGTNSLKDSRDGKIYEIVKIGNQTWMAENLSYLPSVSPSSVRSLTATVYYVYGYEGNDVASAKQHPNYKVYGVLYNWDAANVSCPDGWHLPNDEDWKSLELFLGMSESEANEEGTRDSGSVAKKLKSTELWDVFGSKGDNSSGFKAIAGAYLDNNGFGNERLGYYCTFWTSSTIGPSYAWHRFLNYSEDGITRGNYYRNFGHSVRCIKD
ncbi:MAG: hypothetical protein D4R68_08830 [Ignavibacteriales bacterium]|nr:MAG: hypothetical protein D4R68_08830 [Ignavibacteriales bacterium]